eukprot:evm.model.scf_1052.2 EVM.evm.TU.scf_1052.2   scf_1052:22606-24380(+)
MFGGATACSSCCMIQLVLNALTYGCAGFSVLTPYKGAFRLVALGGAMAVLARGKQPLKWKILAACLGLGVSFSEDLLGAYNRGSLSLPGLAIFGVTPPSGLSVQSLPPDLILHVPGMRCEACAAKVKGAVEGGLPGGSAECIVSLADKSVAVRAAKPGVNIVPSEVVARIKEAGFSAHTEALAHDKEEPQQQDREDL